MVMHYPNGQPYRTKQLSLKKSPYPTATLYGNRGMTLEEEINESNQYYLKQGIAVIMISSELPEIIGASDRIVVLYEGKKMAEFNSKTDVITQEVLMEAASGIAKGA